MLPLPLCNSASKSRTRHTPAKKKGRQDMQGITPYVDLQATLINTRHSKYTKIWRLFPSTEKGTKKWIIDWTAFKPAKLLGKELRRMQTILMGIIRPPHRLKYTKHTDSDTCTHHACHGAKADTEHIFWECKQWDHIRKPYMHQLHLYKSKVSTQGDRTHALDALECLPCFRQCGICPGDERLMRATYNIPEVDGTEYQFQTEHSNRTGTLHTQI